MPEGAGPSTAQPPSPPYRELVIATSNPGKLLEFRAILGDLPLALRALDAFPEVLLPEEGDDYEKNAVAKAHAACAGSGRAAVADDSGLEVAALDGAPGPRSARFGGPGLDDAGRVAALLEALAARGGAEREARFVCVCALALADGRVFTSRGECAGRILEAPRGRLGFGYDPIFEVAGTERSMAELAPARKHALSHRGRALAGLAPLLRSHVVGEG